METEFDKKNFNDGAGDKDFTKRQSNLTQHRNIPWAVRLKSVTHCVDPVLLALCNEDALTRGEGDDVPAQALTAILSALN